VSLLEVEEDAPEISLDADALEDLDDRIVGYAPLIRTVDGRVVGAEVRSGRGRFVLITSPYMASNTGVREADNALALFRIANPSRPDLFFDEFHHGLAHTRSLAGYLRDSALWIAVCQLALALIFLGWRAQQRFGEPLATYEEEARISTDYVRAMSNIYRRGSHHEHALKVLLDDLERTLVNVHRLPPSTAGPAVEAALAAADHHGVAQRLGALRTRALSAAAASRGRANRALAVAQEIATFRDQHSRTMR
jgi:hypothetical protein